MTSPTYPEQAGKKPVVEQSPSPFLERQRQFRDLIEAQLRAGQAITMPMVPKYGHDLMLRAAVWEAVQEVARQQGIDPTQVRITATADDGGMDIRETAEAIFSVGLHEERYPRPDQNLTEYQRLLTVMAQALGIELPAAVYHQAPRIYPVDQGPLKRYDAPRVLELARQLREQLAGRPLVIIAQAGSASEKRFSDQQVVTLAAELRQQQPQAVIVVATDKPFLREQARSYQHQPAERLPATGAELAFPFVEKERRYTRQDVEAFLTELNSVQLPDPDGVVNQVLEGSEINQLLAYFQVADQVVTTDNYWMHLAASQDTARLTALFTLFRPEPWAPPGAEVVTSEVALETTKPDVPASWYHHKSSYANEGRKQNYGIEPPDLAKLVEWLRGGQP